MSASLTASRHASYHQRHAYEMVAALRALRFNALQQEKRIEREEKASPSFVYGVPAGANQIHFLRQARSNLESAIIELLDQRYNQVYPYLDRAESSAAMAGEDSLSDSIAEWREKWLPNNKLNKGGNTWRVR